MKKPIALERFEAGLHAFVATNGDVQVGWRRKQPDGWYVEDAECMALGGPFPTLDAAEKAAQDLLADQAGAGNPGH